MGCVSCKKANGVDGVADPKQVPHIIIVGEKVF